MNGFEFIKFLGRLEENIEYLNNRFNFVSIGNSKIRYNCEEFDENDDTFLRNLDDYIDELNNVMDNEFRVHFCYQYLDENGGIFLYPDYIGDEYIGDRFE